MCVTYTCVSHTHVCHIHMCVTYTCVSHTHVCHIHMCVTHTCVSHTHVCHTHMCVTYTCVSHTHVRHIHMCVTYTCVSHLIHIFNMTYSHVQHDLFTCATVGAGCIYICVFLYTNQNRYIHTGVYRYTNMYIHSYVRQLELDASAELSPQQFQDLWLQLPIADTSSMLFLSHKLSLYLSAPPSQPPLSLLTLSFALFFSLSLSQSRCYCLSCSLSLSLFLANYLSPSYFYYRRNIFKTFCCNSLLLI